MRLIGFNAKQILDGTCLRATHMQACRRGLKKSQMPADADETQNDPPKFAVRYVPIPSPTYISAIAATALEKLFNKVGVIGG